MSFQSENRLLFESCRVERRPLALASESLDWQYLLRAAVYQGVAPLLHDGLTQDKVAAPASASGPLYHHYWTNHFRNRVLLSELERLSRAASAAGIEIVPLKGADLAARFYPSPALRPMSDIDLLVRSEQLDALQRLLPSLGYEDFSMSMSYVDDDRLDRESHEHRWQGSRDGVGVLIEFRAEPMEPSVCRLADLDPSLAGALRDHTSAIWARMTGSTAGRRLAPQDVFLHVATHLAAKHGEFRLIWLHDLARIAAAPAPLDWRAVGDAAGRLQVSGPVRAAMQAAVQLMGAPISPAQLAEFDRAAAPHARGVFRRWEIRALARQADRLLQSDLTIEGPVVSRLVAGLGRLTGWRSRLRALRWVALPSRAYLDRWPDFSGRARASGYGAAWLRRYRRAAERTFRRFF